MPGSTSTASGNQDVLALVPTSVWRFFVSLAGVPRPSKHEEKIQAHARALADELGLAHRHDATGNIVIDVPATPGHESAPPVVLQGHLDMVAEANTGTEHDFLNDPIKLLIDRDADTGDQIVRADGTTLGADNGIGVAMALAAATDDDCVHGPLELLLTSDEEMGMTGAKALEPSFFRGRTLINLDSEEDDAIYIGCAGGADVTLTWALAGSDTPSSAESVRVSVSGLRGGHSGDDIQNNRANANKVLVDVLRAGVDHGLRLVEMQGGSKRNAIPREASAIVATSAAGVKALKKAAELVSGAVLRSKDERNCTIGVESIAPAGGATAASAEDTEHLMTGLTALPSNVIAVTPEMPGLTRTSNNVSTVTTERDGRDIRVIVGCLARSSSEDDKRSVVQRLEAIGILAGADVKFGNEYPGWQPNLDSPVLRVCRVVYERLFGEPPRVSAIHGGLECGIIGQRVGDIDTVSLGPRIEGAHSPDERLWIESVGKSYELLKAILEELANA